MRLSCWHPNFPSSSRHQKEEKNSRLDGGVVAAVFEGLLEKAEKKKKKSSLLREKSADTALADRDLLTPSEGEFLRETFVSLSRRPLHWKCVYEKKTQSPALLGHAKFLSVLLHKEKVDPKTPALPSDQRKKKEKKKKTSSVSVEQT